MKEKEKARKKRQTQLDLMSRDLSELEESNKAICAATRNYVDIQVLLHIAIEFGDCSRVEFFLQNGADANSLAQRDDCSLVESLLKNGANMNLLASSGTRLFELQTRATDVGKHDPPLHVAIALGDLEIVRTLLDHSADVNLRNWRDLTPLHFAAAVGQKDIVELLINRGANVNAKSPTFIDPLYKIAEERQEEVINERLHEMAEGRFFWNDPQKYSPLPLASIGGHVEVVEILLDHGDKLHAIGEYDTLMESFNKRLAIERAILSRQPDTVEILLKMGVSPLDVYHDASTIYEYLEIKECCSWSNDNASIDSSLLRIIDVISMSGLFNANTMDSQAETPVHQIIRKCRKRCDYFRNRWKPDLTETEEKYHLGDKIFKIFLDSGANVNQTNCKGETALMIAAEQGCNHFIRILLDWTKKTGIKLLLDVRDELGETALLKATTRCQVHVVKLLVESGASVNVHDNRGFTALHAANYNELSWFMSDYLYVANERRKRKLDTDEMIQRWYNRHYSLSCFSSGKLMAKRKIAEIILDFGSEIQTFANFAGNKPSDLSVDSSETFADQITAGKNRTQSKISKSTNRSCRFQGCHIDDWERTPFHRLYFALFSEDNSFEDEIIAKKLKLSRMKDLTSTSPSRIELPAPERDNRGRTALHYAAMPHGFHDNLSDLKSSMEMLLNVGISINAVDKYGRTPLHYAEDEKVYSWLVEHGGDEQDMDNKDQSPKYLKQLRERHIEKIDAIVIREMFEYEKSSDTSMLWHLYSDLLERQRFIKRLGSITKELERFVERLAFAIGERDDRFTCKSKLVGSAADGTKIEIPGDFDFDLTLTELSKQCEVHPSPVAPDGFVHVKRKGYESEYILYKREDDFDSFFNEEQLLLVNEVNYKFKFLLEEILQDPHFWENEETFELRNFERYYGSPKSLHRCVKLRMIHPLKDDDGDLYFEELKLDIVPCIHLDNWWPAEALRDVGDEVKSLGCNLVFASPCRFYPWVPFDATYARISFALAESHKMKNCSNLLKAAYSIAKVLCSRELINEKSRLKNGAYVLKSSFLYCIEAFGESTILQEPLDLSLISTKKLYFLIERILFSFVKFCDQDFLPCYFLPPFALPIEQHLKSKHIFNFFLGDVCTNFHFTVRDFYTNLGFGDSETNSNANIGNFPEKDFSSSVIQPLRECFDRESFMAKLCNHNSGTSGTCFSESFESVDDKPINLLAVPMSLLVYCHLIDIKLQRAC